MTYDFAGPWMSTTSHNAPLYGAVSDNSAIQGYLGKGVPASKLVLGIPFYARGFDNVTPVNNGLNQPYSGLPPGTYDAGVYDYNDLAANYVNMNGYTRYWDDTAKEPWLFNGKVFITYEDPTSIQAKTGYVKTQGLGGAMIWELSNDRGRDLLTAVYNGLQ
jgi:chitinase